MATEITLSVTVTPKLTVGTSSQAQKFPGWPLEWAMAVDPQYEQVALQLTATEVDREITLESTATAAFLLIRSQGQVDVKFDDIHNEPIAVGDTSLGGFAILYGTAVSSLFLTNQYGSVNNVEVIAAKKLTIV